MLLQSYRAAADELALCAGVLRFNEGIRNHLAAEPQLVGLAQAHGCQAYAQVAPLAPDFTQWKLFDHCAGVTRLYAAYEAFVRQLLTEWLTILPRIFPAYSGLPEDLRGRYRAGAASVLGRLGGPRYEHLSETHVVASLHNALAGATPYALLVEAFFENSINLRADELARILGSAGLPQCLDWLSGAQPLSEFCAQEATTPSLRLKDLVSYRNDASHGTVEQADILSSNELEKMAQFLTMVCRALHEFCLNKICELAVANGRGEEIGRITEYFDGPAAAIVTMAKKRIAVGNQLYLVGQRVCSEVAVLSIQDNGVDVNEFDAEDGKELGVRFGVRANVGHRVVRLTL